MSNRSFQGMIRPGPGGYSRAGPTFDLLLLVLFLLFLHDLLVNALQVL